MSTPEATDVRKPAGIGPQTIVQKIVHPALAALYLGNVTVPARFEAHRAGGFVTRGQDFPEGTADAFTEAFGVDKVPGWPKGTQYLLRFYAHTTTLFTTTFGGRTLDSAHKMGTSTVYPAPFLGTGYTPSSNPIPEYFMELTELPSGAELWRVEPSGEAKSVGFYVHRQIGWVPTDDVAFGPSRFWPAPATLRMTVRRGLIARYQGRDFDADFANRPGELVLHPLPGQQAPQDFAEKDGARFLQVPDVAVDEIAVLRKRCTWRGAEFELLDVSGDHAVLNFLGENYEVAAQLGLTEVDYRQWRTVAPRAELTDVRDETRALPRGLFSAN
ncbi:hypothetical protein FKR81_31030 [Lentzea tibetensis]|uniref:Uncharacterized protein n=1 Tax=Lentzea tibetensis TaxID=2591470 RepID=A0A563EL39_9PSEU|nr:hypothetical protein [Lentzea tibetensis]TWP47775.1 hypothetical protein FKR81_31030 [Lentzea tibetensis]